MSCRKMTCKLLAGALLVTSLPALADHGRWERYERRHPRVVEHRYPVREVIVERPVYVERQVVVERPVYVDRPVYVETSPRGYHPPVYDPAPVAYPGAYPREPGYPGHREPNMLGAGVGAAVGAVIGSQLGHGHSRGATTAVGAVIGGVLGSQF